MNARRGGPWSARRAGQARPLRRLATIIALLVPGVVSAQNPSAATAPGFLTAYRFHLYAARLAANDQRFEWDTAFGADLDVVDYGSGRITFLAEYAAMLGSELRRFDPNQSTYRLDGTATWRTRAGELAAVFHHISRHLSDRPKRLPIDWNMGGIGYAHTMAMRATRVGLTARALRVIKRSQIDYTGEFGGGAHVDRTVAPHVEAFAAGDVMIMTVARAVLGRDHQTGGRVEAGIRLLGRAGAMEVFGAYERRIDADPFDRLTRTWALAGFRLVGGR